MLCETGLKFFFALVVEAIAYVFSVFLPSGDALRCVVYRSYMGKCNNSVVGGGVGVVKRRHTGGYRGAAVTRRLRDDVPRIAIVSRTFSASECEGTSLVALADWSPSVYHC
jgi:hypothetical protein